jgi:hypothetical protein
MSIREQWRAAALRDQRQVFFTRGPTVKQGTAGAWECAISLVGGWQVFERLTGPQPCPVEGCTYKATQLLSELAVHLNNEHQWDWLTLANKFPPILPEDQP